VIPDDQVEEVRARADIVDIVGEFVPLKKSGKDFKANCPFHEERTPSFYVVPAKGFYNCFGCGESGDSFSFVMKRLGLDFVDAVKYVAGRTGIEIREVSRDQHQEDPNRPLYEASAYARVYFQDRLWDEDGGAKARAYLEERGIGRETAERFGLGWAPDEWRGLREAAGHHGMSEEVLLSVGLIKTSDRSKEPYDTFRGRIVFPIEDLTGRVVGFGGRVIDPDGTPKYLNSPESPIYHKGQVLYGLSWGKNDIRRRSCALIVEGYMDVVSLAAAGLPHAVAPLGTSMTDGQARLLSRYTKRAFLLFDSDAAGLKATFRTGDLLLAVGVHPSVVTLPDGEDPDSIVGSEGPEALQGYIDSALDVVDRKLQILQERDFFSSIERTRSAVDRLLPTLRAVQDRTLRDIYVSKVADRTGVRRETLEEEISRNVHTPGPSRREVRRYRSKPESGPRVPEMGAERKLLILMIKDREWIERVAEHAGPDEFEDRDYRAIFQELLDDPELTHPPEGLDPNTDRVMEGLMSDPEELSQAHRVFEESLGRIRSRSIQHRLTDLDRRIRETGDEEQLSELLAEKHRLVVEAQEYGVDWGPAARRTINIKSDDDKGYT
jgi:DNA primase